MASFRSQLAIKVAKKNLSHVMRRDFTPMLITPILYGGLKDCA